MDTEIIKLDLQPEKQVKKIRVTTLRQCIRIENAHLIVLNKQEENQSEHFVDVNKMNKEERIKENDY